MKKRQEKKNFRNGRLKDGTRYTCSVQKESDKAFKQFMRGSMLHGMHLFGFEKINKKPRLNNWIKSLRLDAKRRRD